MYPLFYPTNPLTTCFFHPSISFTLHPFMYASTFFVHLLFIHPSSTFSFTYESIHQSFTFPTINFGCNYFLIPQSIHALYFYMNPPTHPTVPLRASWLSTPGLTGCRQPQDSGWTYPAGAPWLTGGPSAA